MYKTLSLALMLCSCICSAQTLSTRPATAEPSVDPSIAAQPDRTEVNLPEVIGKKFIKDVENRRDVTWEMKKNVYWITYTDPVTRLQRVIVYDKNGKILRREEQVKHGDYPEAIHSYMNSRYGNAIFKVWRTENPKGKYIYYVPMEKKYIWFNSEGKFIDEKKTR